MSEMNDEEMNMLIKEAKSKGLWLCCRYQDILFSPSELAKKQSEGKFRWGIVNWELCDPAKHLLQLLQNIKRAEQEYEIFNNRIIHES